MKRLNKEASVSPREKLLATIPNTDSKIWFMFETINQRVALVNWEIYKKTLKDLLTVS